MKSTPLSFLFRFANSTIQIIEGVTKRPWFVLTPEEAMVLSQKQTGLSDFGDGDMAERLQMLCEKMDSLPPLTPLARLVRKNDILIRLRNRLYIQHEVKINPAILAEKITRPWIIVGLPRTGSTLLQRLLAQDPAHRAPLCWEANNYFPSPPDAYSKLARIEMMKRNLRLIDLVDPEFRTIHEMSAELPEECFGFLANGLGLTAWTDFSEKGSAWPKSSDMTRTYQLHKRQLQILQKGSAVKTWILKCPIHLLFLRDVLKVYPDACIIQSHRDPLEVLPSTASLLAAIYRTRYEKIDLPEIGAKVFCDMKHMLVEGERARQESRVTKSSSCRFVDVSYSELIQNPIEIICRIYRAMDLTLSLEARNRMQIFLAANRQNRLGKHTYRLEDFGIETADVHREFADYVREYLRT